MAAQIEKSRAGHQHLIVPFPGNEPLSSSAEKALNHFQAELGLRKIGLLAHNAPANVLMRSIRVMHFATSTDRFLPADIKQRNEQADFNIDKGAFTVSIKKLVQATPEGLTPEQKKHFSRWGAAEAVYSLAMQYDVVDAVSPEMKGLVKATVGEVLQSYDRDPEVKRDIVSEIQEVVGGGIPVKVRRTMPIDSEREAYKAKLVAVLNRYVNS
jgi:hypothetical protein